MTTSACGNADTSSIGDVDLFAGCGGMTRGFVDSGRFESVFAVDFDPDAAATYAANFGDAHVHVAILRASTNVLSHAETGLLQAFKRLRPFRLDRKIAFMSLPSGSHNCRVSFVREMTDPNAEM